MLRDLAMSMDVSLFLDTVRVAFHDARAEFAKRNQDPAFDLTEAVMWELRENPDIIYLPKVGRRDVLEHKKDRVEAGSPVTIFPGTQISQTMRVDFIRLGGFLSAESFVVYDPHKHNWPSVNCGIFGEYHLWRSDPLANRDALDVGLVSGWTFHQPGEQVSVGAHEHHAALVPAGSAERDAVIAIVQGGSILHGREDGKVDVVLADEPYPGYFRGYEQGPHGTGLMLPNGPRS